MSNIQAELLKTDGGKNVFFVQTKDKKMPLPLDSLIRNAFADLTEEHKDNIELNSRDDVRHSIVITIPAILPRLTQQTFFERIGEMSGC